MHAWLFKLTIPWLYYNGHGQLDWRNWLTLPHKKGSMCKYKIVDTSIKHQISGQSTSMLKGCMYIFDIVDTALTSYWKSIDRLLFFSGIFQSERKYYVCNRKCRYYVFTSWSGPAHNVICALWLFICLKYNLFFSLKIG